MILLQHASGDSIPLLELAAPINARGVDYRATYGLLQKDRSPHWDKIVVIRNTLLHAREGELVAWLDADTLRLDTAPFALSAGFDLGMALNRRRHFNTGVIVMRKTLPVRQFFDKVWHDGPKQYHWVRLYDQCVINLFRKDLPIEELDSAWNFWPNCAKPPRDTVHVMAWHNAGASHALQGMRAALKRITSP